MKKNNTHKKTKKMRKHLSKSQKGQLILFYKNKCSLCNRTFYANERVEFDHIKELHSGGHNTFSNFQPLCVPCHKLKTYKKKSLHHSYIDFNHTDFEYTNNYDISLIKNHNLPVVTSQKLLKALVDQVNWITQTFNRIDYFKSIICDIEKLIRHILNLKHDRKYILNESFNKELAKFSAILPVFPVSGIKFWIRDALKILKKHKENQNLELDRLLKKFEGDETIRSSLKNWIVKYFYGGTKLLELIMDNLTYEEGYFTTKMILSHEIYNSMIHNKRDKEELSIYMPDKIHLSDWLNRHINFHKFKTDELGLKYERIGYDLKTGEVIYIRNGQYNQIKDKIPIILFEDPQKNFKRNFKVI